MEKLEFIAKGAEADIWRDIDWNGKDVLIKKRSRKLYRHEELDNKLRSFRTIHEALIMNKARQAGVPTPLVYQVIPEEATIIMEYINGEKIRDIINFVEGEKRREIFRVIGAQTGRLHKVGIVHGDLTTSNMIKSKALIFFIDFGLAELSSEDEKRGVDLHLMRRMLTSTHYMFEGELFKAFEGGYRSILGRTAEDVLKKMREIEKRGRYVERENTLDGDT
ncbi:MAG: Kae1-associated kinase Bud32 [Candidatus Bathyarchaeia archaeon]